MGVSTAIIEDDCKFVVMVTATALTGSEALGAVINDLDTALTLLEEEMADSDQFYFQICLEIDGVAPRTGLFAPYEDAQADGPYDPWLSFCPDFWTAATADAVARPLLDNWLRRFLSVLSKAAETAISAPSEFDEVQLGEPIMAHLAMTDPAFIPLYCGFLRAWDFDHEVQISEAVDAIVSHHGYTEDTAALLAFCLLEKSFGQDGDLMLLETFRRIHPSAPKSGLFKRYVVAQYRQHLFGVAESLRVFQSELRKDENADAWAVPSYPYHPIFQTDSKFGQIEEQLVHDLESAHLSSSQTPGPARPGGGFGRFFGRS